jgi:hypothetical protein
MELYSFCDIPLIVSKVEIRGKWYCTELCSAFDDLCHEIAHGELEEADP